MKTYMLIAIVVVAISLVLITSYQTNSNHADAQTYAGWEHLPSYYTSIRTDGTNAFMIQGKLYVQRPDASGVPTDPARYYDIGLGKYVDYTIPSFGRIAGGSSGCAFTSSFYVTRGWVQADFAKYDVSTSTWTVLAPLPFITGQGGKLFCNNVDGNVYAIAPGIIANQLWRFSTSNGTWTRLADFPLIDPIATRDHPVCGVFVLNALYVTTQHHILVYNATTNVWNSKISAMGMTVKNGCMMVQDPDNPLNVYMIRGSGNEIALLKIRPLTSSVWFYFIDQTLPQTVSVSGDRAGIYHGYLYLLRGDGTSQFWRIPVSSFTTYL